MAVGWRMGGGGGTLGCGSAQQLIGLAWRMQRCHHGQVEEPTCLSSAVDAKWRQASPCRASVAWRLHRFSAPQWSIYRSAVQHHKAPLPPKLGPQRHPTALPLLLLLTRCDWANQSNGLATAELALFRIFKWRRAVNTGGVERAS